LADSQSPWLSLSSGELSAEINPLGAQLSVLRDREDRDLLWDGDPIIWNGRAPLLFPIVGMLAGGRYRIGEHTYGLPRHGFARGKLFEVKSATDSSAELVLRSDAETLAVYPFEFELEVRYLLRGTALSITTWVRNHGEQPMPASFGYHPAFRWPLPYGQPRAAHFIQFETDEPAPARRLNSAGLLRAEQFPTPIDRKRLQLADYLFQDDVLIFDRIRSRSVSYGAASGPRLTVVFPDSPYLGVWTKPGAGFICIEPWHGIADPQGFDGELSAKPGIFILPATEALPISMTISLTPG